MKHIEEIELPIGGMTCATCARTIEKQLGGTAGVEKASVNFATHIASVQYDAGLVSIENLVSAVEDVGYEVPSGPLELAEQAEARDLKRRFVVGVAFAAPVFVLGMAERWPLLQMILALPVLGYSGFPFFRDAWTALRHGSANMNTLIALGTGAAFGYSVWVLTSGGMDVYFEAAAVIVALVLLGRMLEARARGRASDAIRQLMNLQPPQARVVRDGKELAVGIVSSLKRLTDDVQEVRQGFECGLGVEGFTEYKPGDTLEFYVEEYK